MGHSNDPATWAAYHKLQRDRFYRHRRQRLAKRIAYFLAVLGALALAALGATSCQ